MNSITPPVSVVIPAYNASRFLAEAIDSVLGQTYRNYEVIVVDDGSTDDTHEILASYGNVITVISQSNQGLSAARNAGIKESNGEFIAFLDADDVWEQDKLRRQVEAMVDNPDVALVHTGTLKWHFSTGEFNAFSDDATRYQGECFDALLEHCSICVSSVMVRKAMLDNVGVFDINVRRPTTQDYDLWLRLAHRFPFAYVEEPLVRYRWHADNASGVQEIMWEDCIYVFNKLLGSIELSSDRKQRVYRKLAELSFDLGYFYFESGAFKSARRRLFASWLARREHLYPLALCVSTLATVSGVRILRQVRAKSSRRNCRPAGS